MDEHSRSDKSITITYAITCPREDIGTISENIALEQTVEVPAAVIRDARIFKDIVGKVLGIDEAGGPAGERFNVRIAYSAIVSNFEIPQFLNLLYGNISFKPGIKVIDIEFSDEFIQSFTGPRFGIEGTRKLLGVYDRPLVATALKPMGTSVEDLAEMCYRFALGGIDIIKDDHGLVDFPFCRFEERVAKCVQAVESAQQKTGKRTMYFPNITDRFDRIERNAEFAVKSKAGGLLISPFITGLDCVRYIAGNALFDLPIMSHPSLTGIFYSSPECGIAPEIVIGKIFRLAGIDSSVYPNYGGRFSFSKDTCLSIAHSLTEGMAHIRSSFPTPAGGMELENITEIVKFYGNDIILLVGGSLYGRSDDLTANARYFCEKVKEAKQ
ncbi:MAG: ribulose 1,5-bisphosphate carboxylase large subunit [Nitrospirae bacterium]|nr:ribulose 1,5-bisphosphate carboxylase large subunit [Nitrospirota bacterium]